MMLPNGSKWSERVARQKTTKLRVGVDIVRQSCFYGFHGLNSSAEPLVHERD